MKAYRQNNTTAKIIQHSQHFQTGKELIALEIEFPRIILAEVNTHKILVRNTQSTRAVPISSAIEQLESGNHFKPVFWGKNQSGMVAKEEHDVDVVLRDIPLSRDVAWDAWMKENIKFARAFSDAKYHKQIAGRPLEAFSMVRMVISGTEWDNFFNLRIEPSAQPEFRDLAIKVYLAIQESRPFYLKSGEWHVPYVDRVRDDNDIVHYYVDGNEVDLETAKNISLSCIAQTSYRKQDKSQDKADIVIDRLFNGDVIHASPAESVGTPIDYNEELAPCFPETWPMGVTHMDRDMNLWSAQFKDYIQYRHLIPNNTCWDFTEEKFNLYESSF